MLNPIVHSSGPITLVGGGQATSQDLAEALTIAPKLVAVDGGLHLTEASGISPEAVIGDMDSAPPEALRRIPKARQHLVSEQQTTDFDKALRHVAAPVVLGVGFCGGRLDHQLAAFHTMLVHAERPCVLIAEREIILIAPPHIAVDTVAGETVSLFPLVPVQGRSTGLQWPIEGLHFDPADFVGTSNRATGAMRLWMDTPGMLLILPRAHLAKVAAHFTEGGGGWVSASHLS